MNKKKIGPIVFIMLLLPAISAIGTYDINIDNKEIQNLNLEDDLSIVIYKPLFSIGVNLDIKNNGGTVLNNIEWSFRSKASITGTGIFMKEKLQEGIIDEVAPGEKITIELRPFSKDIKSPFGLGNLYMNASAEVNNISVRTQQRALILGYFLIQYRDTYMDIKPK